MAKEKKKRGKQGWFSKLINAGGVVIGLARPIMVLSRHGFSRGSFEIILNELTFGMIGGNFDLQAGLRMYAPVGAAVGYRELTKYLARHFPVR